MSDISKIQMEHLFNCLKLEHDNKGMEIKGLTELIVRTKVGMQPNDADFVEKMIASLKS